MLKRIAIAVLVLGVPRLAAAQVASAHRPWAANVVVPQSRAFAVSHLASARPAPVVLVTEVDVGVVILEQAATTTMNISLRNPSASRVEAELLVPVPEGVAVRGFTFQGSAGEPTAQVLPKDEAKRAYTDIVAKVRDPALLEFAGLNLIRSSVFPVEANGVQEVQVTYEHLLSADGNRVDYFLPRSESLDYAVPWKVAVRITASRPISTVYSPTHNLATTRSGPHTVFAQPAYQATTQPGPFRLSYLLEGDGVSASLLAYPDPKAGGGYFLLLAGLPAELPKGQDAIKRELTLVIDRSGSMHGEKIEQVREAALQVLAGLQPGEAFNVIAYNDAVEPFAAKPVFKSDETMAKAREFLKGLTARGGTNIHDALLEALRQKPVVALSPSPLGGEGRGEGETGQPLLPIVLFLTDGLPTVGQTSEVAIRNVALQANPYHRRIFTFGVGVDVNTALLDKIAEVTRATATFVLPKEDVEVKVGRVFKRLTGPVLAEPKLASGPAGGPTAILDVLPARLPDLYEGDQLVVLGRYVGAEPLRFRLAGNYLGRARSFTFTFDLARATTRNAFIPRLWASRKIAVLIDAIRDLGADAKPLDQRRTALADPRLKELVDEIVRLSTEFGILTEYTAFLAREGTDLSKRDRVLEQARRNFEDRAMRTRVGLGAVNQDNNSIRLRGQQELNLRNEYFDENMNPVAVTNVQQVNDRAFYQRGNRWVDSRFVEQEKTIQPAREIEVGSPEFFALLARLVEEGRPGSVALKGDVLIEVDGRPVLIKGADTAAVAH